MSVQNLSAILCQDLPFCFSSWEDRGSQGLRKWQEHKFHLKSIGFVILNPTKTSVDMCLDKSINFAFPLTLKFHFPKDRESTLLSSNSNDIPVSCRQYKEHAWQWNTEIDVKWYFQKNLQRLPISIFFLNTWVILNFFSWYCCCIQCHPGHN